MKKIIWSDSHLTSDGEFYKEFFIERGNPENSEGIIKYHMSVDWANSQLEWAEAGWHFVPFKEKKKPEIPVFKGKRLREVKL